MNDKTGSFSEKRVFCGQVGQGNAGLNRVESISCCRNMQNF